MGDGMINQLTRSRAIALRGSAYFPISFYLAIVIGFLHTLLILFTIIGFGIYEFDDFWERSGGWPVSVSWSFIALYGLLGATIILELASSLISRRGVSAAQVSVYILCGCVAGVGLMLSYSALTFAEARAAAYEEGSGYDFSGAGPNSLHVQYIPFHARTDRSISGYNISEHAICDQALEIPPQERDEWARKIVPTHWVRRDLSFQREKVRMQITTPDGISYITDASGNVIVTGPDWAVSIVDGWRDGVYGTYKSSLPSGIIAYGKWEHHALNHLTEALELRLAMQGCAIPKSCYRPEWIKGAVSLDECRPLPDRYQSSNHSTGSALSPS